MSSANRCRCARKGELMDTIGRDELVALLAQPGTVLVEALPAEHYWLEAGLSLDGTRAHANAGGQP